MFSSFLFLIYLCYNVNNLLIEKDSGLQFYIIAMCVYQGWRETKYNYININRILNHILKVQAV